MVLIEICHLNAGTYCPTGAELKWVPNGRKILSSSQARYRDRCRNRPRGGNAHFFFGTGNNGAAKIHNGRYKFQFKGSAFTQGVQIPTLNLRRWTYRRCIGYHVALQDVWEDLVFWLFVVERTWAGIAKIRSSKHESRKWPGGLVGKEIQSKCRRSRSKLPKSKDHHPGEAAMNCFWQLLTTAQHPRITISILLLWFFLSDLELPGLAILERQERMCGNLKTELGPSSSLCKGKLDANNENPRTPCFPIRSSTIKRYQPGIHN